MLIKMPKGWELPESAATPESVYMNRRTLLKAMGIGGVALAGAGCFFSVDEPPRKATSDNPFEGLHAELYPAPRNERYRVPERPVTDEQLVTTYNNFYEFTTSKRVYELVDRFTPAPWTVEVTGLVHNPQTFDFDTLIQQMPLEERIYRLRCVEAWSCTVPWTGFPLSRLLDLVEPMSSATHIRFETALRTDEMPGITARPNYPWPYHEGLTIAEATNELTMMVTGAYGNPLLNQDGPPIRLIVPWKYGYKNIKSIVKIELVDSEPATFWHTLVPNEYPFVSNVNPNVPHPRWSQATEQVLGLDGRVDTMIYNGYGEYVADLYV